MRVLVTGGCGFIGSNFVRFLLGRPGELGQPVERVVNLDALTYAGNPENLAELDADPRYRFVHGNIGDANLVGGLLNQERVDTLVHFAAESHVDRSIENPGLFLETNITGTYRLLDQSLRYWKVLPTPAQAQFRFLHVSTDEVYGSLGPNDPPFSEHTPYAPNSPYAASKAASDHLVRAYHHTYQLPVVTTNCSNNYGPYQFPEKLIPLMILNALEGRPLPIYGDGLNVRDWLYVGDHCAGIGLVLQRGVPGQTYNIGGQNEQTNLSIVDQVCATLDRLAPRPDGLPYARLKTFVPDRPGHDRRYAIDCTKIQRELSWAPRESFATGLAKTVRWYLDHRAWCERISAGKYQRQRLGLVK